MHFELCISLPIASDDRSCCAIDFEQQCQFGLIQPLVIDYSAHILRLCEAHCELVSKSGVLRVDLGVEFMSCTVNAAGRMDTEEELRDRQKQPSQWQLTGAGFIVRFFLNEVTSTLDINCQSKHNRRWSECG